MSRPSNTTDPRTIRAPDGWIPRMTLPIMLLPAPDSPTSPCTSPGAMSSDTPRRIGVCRRRPAIARWRFRTERMARPRGGEEWGTAAVTGTPGRGSRSRRHALAGFGVLDSQVMAKRENTAVSPPSPPSPFDVVGSPEAMRLLQYRLHALKGKLKGDWSVTVRANWRIIFRFEDGDVHDVELIDYH